MTTLPIAVDLAQAMHADDAPIFKQEWFSRLIFGAGLCLFFVAMLLGFAFISVYHSDMQHSMSRADRDAIHARQHEIEISVVKLTETVNMLRLRMATIEKAMKTDRVSEGLSDVSDGQVQAER